VFSHIVSFSIPDELAKGNMAVGVMIMGIFIGIGTALLEAVEAEARNAGCRKLWLITTNDNLDAFRFFQRRGFVVSAFRLGTMNEIRRLKPNIPEIGCYDIPVRDEIEMEKRLDLAGGWRVVRGNGGR